MIGELENVNEGKRIISTLRPIEPHPHPPVLYTSAEFRSSGKTLEKKGKMIRGVVLRPQKDSRERFCHLDFDESWHATTANGFRVQCCKYADVPCFQALFIQLHNFHQLHLTQAGKTDLNKQYHIVLFYCTLQIHRVPELTITQSTPRPLQVGPSWTRNHSMRTTHMDKPD